MAPSRSNFPHPAPIFCIEARIWERPAVKVLWATRHEERFPWPRLSGGCGFRKETVTGTRRNERDGPTAVVGENSRRLHVENYP